MDCPYCSDRLIRQIQHQHIYWFCRSCWQPISPIEASSIVDSPLEDSLLGDSSIVDLPTVDLLPIESPSISALIQKSEMRIASVGIDTYHSRGQADLQEAQRIEKTIKSA